ncbi:hypothetical protein [Bacteroides oleiciplenus]|uniref:Uncharacterized protein n=1 Tax=Bacteroides oleiciplenus TaxID=626931 RepID=A0A3E5B0H2_9BACE|nr:hypothetical protein [Bacteroides oleiciplenus]MBD9092190.1 hypothetical protein [Bacteroides oleiciplenus]RGN30984.1 hypothetical protein DXB65_21945 [Bacteroides oleiciplenus]
MNLAVIAEVLDLILSDKFHIDSGRKGILEAVARQILLHKNGDTGTCQSHEVDTWATVLALMFFVENHRNKSKSISAESIVTELNNLLSEVP